MKPFFYRRKIKQSEEEVFSKMKATDMENRWMELAKGEAYEYRLNRYASVFLFRERRKKWVAWYARWAKDRPEPIKCRDITRTPCDAKEARRQAEAFIQNWLNWMNGR